MFADDTGYGVEYISCTIKLMKRVPFCLHESNSSKGEIALKVCALMLYYTPQMQEALFQFTCLFLWDCWMCMLFIAPIHPRWRAYKHACVYSAGLVLLELILFQVHDSSSSSSSDYYWFRETVACYLKLILFTVTSLLLFVLSSVFFFFFGVNLRNLCDVCCLKMCLLFNTVFSLLIRQFF